MISKPLITLITLITLTPTSIQAQTSADFARFVGGSDKDVIRDVATDDSGNIYITGRTRSGGTGIQGYRGYPSTGNTYDLSEMNAYIFKLKPDGSDIVWGTYNDWGQGTLTNLTN